MALVERQVARPSEEPTPSTRKTTDLSEATGATLSNAARGPWLFVFPRPSLDRGYWAKTPQEVLCP